MYRRVGFLQRGLARANSVRSFDHAGMATLVVAEHDNKVPTAPHAITACYRQAPCVRVQRSFTWYGVCSMQSIKSATLNTITAATKLGDDVHLLVAGKDCAAAAAEGSKVLVGHTASIYTEVACSCRRPFKVLTRRVCGACPARADCWREEGPLARPRFAGQLFGRKRCHRGERRAGARDQPLSHAPSPR